MQNYRLFSYVYFLKRKLLVTTCCVRFWQYQRTMNNILTIGDLDFLLENWLVFCDFHLVVIFSMNFILVNIHIQFWILENILGSILGSTWVFWLIGVATLNYALKLFDRSFFVVVVVFGVSLPFHCTMFAANRK